MKILDYQLDFGDYFNGWEKEKFLSQLTTWGMIPNIDCEMDRIILDGLKSIEVFNDDRFRKILQWGSYIIYYKDDKLYQMEWIQSDCMRKSWPIAELRTLLGFNKNFSFLDKKIIEMSKEELLSHALEWEGIIGCFEKVIKAVETIYNIDLK